MIVESMNTAELEREVEKDFEKMRASTELRLSAEYDKERRKYKIDKKRTYTKVYPIKTASKNTWLIFIGKAPAKERYSNIDCAKVNYIVYFYNSKGLSVIHRCKKGIELYYGHFFKRYNERMNLGLNNSIDVVKQYFKHGGNTVYKSVKKEEKTYTIGVSSEGILLGETQCNGRILVNKTFISRNLARDDQDAVEKELISKLKMDILRAMLTDDEDNLSANIVTAINGSYVD